MNMRGVHVCASIYISHDNRACENKSVDTECAATNVYAEECNVNVCISHRVPAKY